MIPENLAFGKKHTEVAKFSAYSIKVDTSIWWSSSYSSMCVKKTGREPKWATNYAGGLKKVIQDATQMWLDTDFKHTIDLQDFLHMTLAKG